MGSSPLTRGKLAAQPVDPLSRGLIPAHAGKTYRGNLDRPLGRAHPRSRGENPRGRSVGVDGEGSSPLTRGKRPVGEPFPRPERLIPAHAGKTRRSLSTAKTARAHPRSRGENA